jgi:electron transfer flavoprotein beta subunit
MKRVVVCMKQVPSTAAVGFDPATNNLDRSGAPTMTNPADLCALEAALALRDRRGCAVAALTMGRPDAASLLREAAERGATELYLVSDPAFAGSDTFATATILRRTLEWLGSDECLGSGGASVAGGRPTEVAHPAAGIRTGCVDLVLCGRRAIDGETGQTGPELAELLGLPCVTNAIGLDLAAAEMAWASGSAAAVTTGTGSASEGAASGASAAATEELLCSRLADRGTELIGMRLPGLVTVCEGMNRLRPASIACMRKARTIPIVHIDNGMLKLDASTIGSAGSATRVRRLYPPKADPRRCVPETDSLQGARIACEKIAGILGLGIAGADEVRE